MTEELKAKIKEEIREFDKLIKKYPFVDELYIGRAVLYLKIGENDKALKDFERGHENYIYNITAVCLRNNLSREIERFYTEKINEDKNNIVNYISRARLYIRMGENKKALADCEIILKHYPESKYFLEFKKALIKDISAEERAKRMKIPKIFLK